METKLAQLKRHIANGDHRAALNLAGSWGALGKHKEAITRGKAACNNPGFYKSLGQDPTSLQAAGIAAIHERYEIPLPGTLQWNSWCARHRPICTQHNDGTIDGCWRAAETIGGKEYVGFGKTKELALADLTNTRERNGL